MPMAPVRRINADKASALEGRPVIDWEKTIWFSLITGLALWGMVSFTWAAFSAFVIVSYSSLLFGHSIGMHRMLIHRSFKAKKLLAYPLIWLGTMVGMGGPSKIILIHDLRDWAQRQSACHDFFSHRRTILRDLSWQLFYRFKFDREPVVKIEDDVVNDPFYRHLDRWWFAHQAGVACGLFLLGGMPFVSWVFGVRIFISVIGHWCVTYVCHNPGPGKWRVEGAGVQASNLKGFISGVLTHGECWHNNHHAFPESAKIGLEKDQIDPAWHVIKWFEKCNLVSDVGTPRAGGDRDDLTMIGAYQS